MAAHFPRRMFAAPFVVTLAAACGGDATPTPKNPPPQNPPDPVASASVAPTASVAPPATATPTPTATVTSDAPISAAPSEDHDEAWLVNKSGTKCTATLQLPLTNEMPTTFPKPTDYACLTEAPEFPIVVRRYAGHSNCIIKTTPEPKCRPMSTCNPPPPRYAVVACPK